MCKIEIINSADIAKDISSLGDHIASLSFEDKEWFSKVYFREVIKSQNYVVQSQDALATHVKYVGSSELTANARYIVDWVAGLQERDPKQHSKLPRITFQQALKHSEKWHAELVKQAEKSDRYIEPDVESAPKVLDLDDGWEVFWLKTKKAKIAEGEVMGHCVGSGAYDSLEEGEEVFSIRKNNVAHITLHMDKLLIRQAVTKGNGDVPERYQYLVDEASGVLSLNLFLGRKLNDSSTIPDGWHENSKGDKVHINDGIKCRKNGPAVIYPDGSQQWWMDDKIHRDDGPAVIREDGSQEWYKNGKLHRDDGPAVICADGTQKWFLNDKLHREDGPAIIYVDSSQVWYYNGKRHRDDGPSVIYTNGTQEWWINGRRHRENRPAVISVNGRQEWWLNGQRHRYDGPAVVRSNGMQEWFLNNKRHREDGPAVIYPDGSHFWHRNGKVHRDDGPAVTYQDGRQEWWDDGKEYTEDEFNKIIGKPQKAKTC